MLTWTMDSVFHYAMTAVYSLVELTAEEKKKQQPSSEVSNCESHAVQTFKALSNHMSVFICSEK